MIAKMKRTIALIILIFSYLTQANEPLEFQKLIFETKKLLPKIKKVEGGLNGKVQTVPYEYFEVAQNIRDLKSISSKDSNLKKEVSTLLDGCALNSKVTNVIRALCLTHLVTFRSEEKVKVDWSKYPKSLKPLVSIITGE